MTFTTKESCGPDEFLLPSGELLGTCTKNTNASERILAGDGRYYGGPGSVIQDKEATTCSLGNYCPLTNGAYDTLKECDVGKEGGDWCPEGMVAPLDCPVARKCKADAMGAGAAGLSMLLVYVVLVLLFWLFMRYRKAKRLKDSVQASARHAEPLTYQGVRLPQGQEEVCIEFENVGLQLKTKGKKNIIQNINGCFPPKSLCALMGPSGCGKTTFMNALCNKARYGKVTGTVRVNGKVDGLAGLDSLIGFVPQDDTVHPNLTVYDNLYYSAFARLPASMSKLEKMDEIETVIKVLGLDKVRNCLVGDAEKRGVSGGQRKRVNIGVELVARPAVLFMDEPLTALPLGELMSIITPSRLWRGMGRAGSAAITYSPFISG